MTYSTVSRWRHWVPGDGIPPSESDLTKWEGVLDQLGGLLVTDPQDYEALDLFGRMASRIWHWIG